jgi:hypothetical protein
MKRTLCALGLIALCLTWVTSAAAGTLAAAKASQVIELRSGSPPSACPSLASATAMDTVEEADGTSTSGFTVPAGKVLVVTDVNFDAFASAGDSVTLGVRRSGPSAFNSMVNIGATAAPTGVVVATASLRGAVVKSGTAVCITCFDQNTVTFLTPVNCQGVLHGFLAKDS